MLQKRIDVLKAAEEVPGDEDKGKGKATEGQIKAQEEIAELELLIAEVNNKVGLRTTLKIPFGRPWN